MHCYRRRHHSSHVRILYRLVLMVQPLNNICEVKRYLAKPMFMIIQLALALNFIVVMHFVFHKRVCVCVWVYGFCARNEPKHIHNKNPHTPTTLLTSQIFALPSSIAINLKHAFAFVKSHWMHIRQEQARAREIWRDGGKTRQTLSDRIIYWLV